MRKAMPVLVLVIGLASLYPMQRWIDQRFPREAASEETLYLANGETIKRMSLGHDGLVAGLYWIRTIQYFGRKFIDSGLPLSAASTEKIEMRLLAPLLDIVVTLDPHHLPAYRFGAIFLPERDLPAAISLLERGIEANPGVWRLHQDIGYIYWQQGEYERAAEWYERGARIEGSPWWMRDMAGVMKIRGGTREVARRIYGEYLESEDRNIQLQAAERLKQLDALDEIDAMNDLMKLIRERTGECIRDPRILANRLQSMGFRVNENGRAVDPDGFEYEFDAEKCEFRISRASTIPL